MRSAGGKNQRHRVALAGVVFCVALLAVFFTSEAFAQQARLQRYLADIPAGELMTGATGYGEPKPDLAARSILKGNEIIGHAFLNTDWVNATGYSGKAIHILIALDHEGVIRGLRLMDHHEPIVLIGIPEEKIRAVMDNYVGRNIVRETVEAVDVSELNIIAGATVTILVIDDSIRRAAVKFARTAAIAGLSDKAQGKSRFVLKDDAGDVTDWQTLLGDGSIRRLVLTVGDVTQAFLDTGQNEAAANPEADDAQARFIALYAALVSQPTIGRSLLGEREFQNLKRRLDENQHAVMLMGSGAYSFKGSGYVRGGVFDRIQLVQGDEATRFRDRHHKRIGAVAAEGAPEFGEVSIFRIPQSMAFDPTKPWRVELLVGRAIGAREKAFTSFDLSYRLPERFLDRLIDETGPGSAGSSAADVPDTAIKDAAEVQAREALWQRIWRDSIPEIAVLTVLLGVLTIIFFFQDWLVKRKKLMSWVRYSFLIVVLFWLGFYMNAQLSVVNVLTFANALITDFNWGYFLMAPLIFILWVGVAAGMIFWGRGVFCGWLCPYGALQELTNRLGRLFGIRQIELPWGLNERLWPIKYIVFLAIFGLSFYSMSLAERAAEVEPFKTAIIMNFARAWPFVVFAGGLIVVNLFIERFFCRYLCPLGAALAIPGKLRMFDWLKRYKECGSPCQICAQDCPTAAIHPDGRINVNECIYCLDCQKIYYDDRRCPHMIQDRLRRERRLQRASDSTLTAAQQAEKAALLKANRPVDIPGSSN